MADTQQTVLIFDDEDVLLEFVEYAIDKGHDELEGADYFEDSDGWNLVVPPDSADDLATLADEFNAEDEGDE